MCFLAILLVYCVLSVTAFNVDHFNHAYFRGRDASMFGFSVAIHKARNQGWVLVGAPEDQSRYQTSVNQSGVVYKCYTNKDGACEEIPFDRNGDILAGESFQRKPLDSKSYQWFGATLSATGTEEGRVVACAPRYVWFTEKFNRKDPVGTCYVSNGIFTEFNEYSPCRARNRWGYHRQGSCQAGFSASLDSDGNYLFMGAPGSWYWQGQVISIDANERFPYTPGFLSTFGNPLPPSGSVSTQSLTRRTAVYSTSAGSARDDDSYMGYSQCVIKFAGYAKQGVAVGMPRGDNLHGKVLLYTWNLENFQNFSSSQIGSYFGYAMAAADVDGDGQQDLIIGAPMHVIANTEGKYDVGRVYVIFQKDNFKTEPRIIDGFNSKSRFGQALACLRDINQDGFEDFAVGAPYDGPGERGAVYIYHGSSEGVREKYSQVIYAKDISSYPVNTFGFSLSGGMDLDGNGYPDMAVGAYNSNSAFFFRSRPVVQIDAYVQYGQENKQIDIKNKNCQGPNGEEFTCTSIDFCIRYTGMGIPSDMKVDLNYIVDPKHRFNPRMLFMDRNTATFNESVVLRKDEPHQCTTKRVYIKDDITDKLTPLDAEVRYWIHSPRSTRSYSQQRDPNSRLEPIIDLDSPPSRKDSLVIFKNCGSDNVCVPNLKVTAASPITGYLLGSPDDLKIEIIIKNFGEDSFETKLQVNHPNTLQFVGKDDIAISTPVSCEPYNTTQVRCDIGNPLPAGKVSRFYMRFSEFAPISDTLKFYVFVNSTNPEDESTQGDNSGYLPVDVIVNAKLDLLGESYPKSLQYNMSMGVSENITTASEMGPPVTYIYYLTNLGPSPVYESEVFFVWPYQTLEGEDLLYLVQQPQTLGNVHCDVAPADKDHYRFSEFIPKDEFKRLNITGQNIAFSQQQKPFYFGNGTKPGITIETGTGTKVVPGGVFELTVNETGPSPGDTSFEIQSRHNISTSSKDYIQRDDEYIYTTRFVDGLPIVTTTTKAGRVVDVYRINFQNTRVTSGQHIYAGRKDDSGIGGWTHKSEGYYPDGNPHKDDRIINWDSSSTSQQQGSFGRHSSQGGMHSTSTFHSGGQFSSGGQQTYFQQGPSEGKKHKFVTNVIGDDSLGGSQEASGTYFTQGSSGSQQGSSNGRTYFTQGSNGQQGSFEGRQGSSETYFTQGSVSGQHGAMRGSQGVSRQGTVSSHRVTNSGRPTSYEITETRTYEIPITVSGGNITEHTYRTGNVARGHGGLGVTDYGRSGSSSTYYQQSSSSGSGGRSHSGGSQFQNQEGNSDYDDPRKLYESRRLDQTFNNMIGVAGGENVRGSSINIDPGYQIHVTEGNVAAYDQEQNARRSSSSSSSSSSSFQSGSGTSGEWRSEGQWTRRGSPPSSYGHNSIDSNNDDFSGTRGKRQAAVGSENPYAKIHQVLPCRSSKCFYMRCVVGELQQSQQVVVALVGRINMHTIRKMSTSPHVTLSTLMSARIVRLPYVGTKIKRELRTVEVNTTILPPAADLKHEVVPLWVVVLSAVAGALILLLLILLLYKLGFFKRNRPSNAPERQPLNRNGYHHGDEAL